MSLTGFKLLTKADVAAIFGVCTKTIDNYVRERRLPAPVPFASREYWHPAAFQTFLDDTFLRSNLAGPDGPPLEANDKPEAGVRPSAQVVTPRDSNPVVRQQRRQQEKLRRLNAEA
jgi:hypothetical protein